MPWVAAARPPWSRAPYRPPTGTTAGVTAPVGTRLSTLLGGLVDQAAPEPGPVT